MINLDDLIEPDKINEKTLDLVYENGIKFVEATRKSIEVIANKSVLLLSYLTIVSGSLVTSLISFVKNYYMTRNSFDMVLIISISIFLAYYVAIILWVIKFGKPREVQIGYSKPIQMMNKKSYCQDGESFDEFHYIKYGRCIEIQQDIDINLSILKERRDKFENALACTLILPLIWRSLNSIYLVMKSTCDI